MIRSGTLSTSSPSPDPNAYTYPFTIFAGTRNARNMEAYMPLLASETIDQIVELYGDGKSPLTLFYTAELPLPPPKRRLITKEVLYFHDPRSTISLDH